MDINRARSLLAAALQGVVVAFCAVIKYRNDLQAVRIETQLLIRLGPQS
jgi:hypothetical protein